MGRQWFWHELERWDRYVDTMNRVLRYGRPGASGDADSVRGNSNSVRRHDDGGSPHCRSPLTPFLFLLTQWCTLLHPPTPETL
jgi:hypothetical protein